LTSFRRAALFPALALAALGVLLPGPGWADVGHPASVPGKAAGVARDAGRAGTACDAARAMATGDAARAGVARDAGRSGALTVVHRGPARGRRVALTFDDCGDSAAWSSILTTLRRARTHATFFPIGRNTVAHPDLARRMVAAAHDVGNHSWSHVLLTSMSYEDAVSELRAADAALLLVTGRRPGPFLRPPFGRWSRALAAAAADAGCRYIVKWDVDGRDWKGAAAARIVARVLGRAGPGSIVALHTCRQTAAALPAILEGLRSRGLRPVTLHQLLGLKRGAGTAG